MSKKPDKARLEDYGDFVKVLMNRKGELSKRLQQVAQFYLNNPEDAAIYTIVEIAKSAGVQPSTITRFAKEMGFDGFTDLQNVFKQRLLGPRTTYADRLRAIGLSGSEDGDTPADPQDPIALSGTFIQAAVDALLRLHEELQNSQLREFVEALRSAPAIHIVGARGAFGVASYTYYGLSRIGKRAFLMDNLGAMREQQLSAMGDDDVLLAMAFDDYTPETIEIARQAHAAGKRIFAITDNELSPIAALGEHTLFVKEARLGHFRSQVPAMVLCQTIVMSLGYSMPHREIT